MTKPLDLPSFIKSNITLSKIFIIAHLDLYGLDFFIIGFHYYFYFINNFSCFTKIYLS